MFPLIAVDHAFFLFDFQNNLINWVLLVVFVGWLVSKNAPAILLSRKEQIETMLLESKKIKEEGELFLAQQNQKVSNAEQEFQKILSEAKEIAVSMRQDMEVQVKREVAESQSRIKQEIEGDRQLAVMHLRSAVTEAAVALSQKILPSVITDKTRARFKEQFIEQVEANHSHVH